MKPLVGFFNSYSGRERPECFAHFHHRVYSVSHIGQAGVGEYAAVTERPWAKLHSPAIPADDLAISYEFGRRITGVSKAIESGHANPVLEGQDCGVYFILRVLGAQERDGHSAVPDFLPAR